MELVKDIDCYAQIVNATQDMIAYIDKEYRYQIVNDAYLDFHHKTKDQIIGKKVDEIIGVENFTHIKLLLDKAFSGESFTIKGHYKIPLTQEMHYEEGSFAPLKDEAKEVIGAVVTIRDTTKLEIANQKAIQEHKRAEEYLDIAEVMLLTLDENANITLLNKKASKILGYEKDELLGKNWIDTCVPKALQKEVHHVFSQIIAGNINFPHYNENEVITKSGEKRFIAWNNVLIRDENSKIIGTLSSGEDFTKALQSQTKLKVSKEKLEYQALHDALTGIPNRLHLSTQLEYAIKSAKHTDEKIALLFLDLDDFKIINDTYGHDIGDTILIEAVSRIQSILSDSDTLTRFSGDEFVVISEHLESITATDDLAHKILQSFEKPFIINQKSHFIGISIGITLFPDDAQESKSLIKSADSAMHRAKREGKNQYAFYTQELTEKLFEQLMIENSLREAIATEQFELYYQPQISLKNKKIIGFEALIRWNHRDLGIISPVKFIPIAEKTKLIIPLGEWILTTACMQVQKWVNKGIFEGKIAVNVSVVQLEHSDFLKSIKDALILSKLDPSKLEIEITESVLMQDPQRWITLLDKIKALGVSIAIDDFGTGYSSLAYLRHFPLDKLKIDKSFVDDIPHDSDACSIANAVVALAKSMGFSTLAEGVETQEQSDFLESLNCESVQGYLYDKPLKAEEAEKRLV